MLLNKAIKSKQRLSKKVWSWVSEKDCNNSCCCNSSFVVSTIVSLYVSVVSSLYRLCVIFTFPVLSRDFKGVFVSNSGSVIFTFPLLSTFFGSVIFTFPLLSTFSSIDCKYTSVASTSGRNKYNLFGLFNPILFCSSNSTFSSSFFTLTTF